MKGIYFFYLFLLLSLSSGAQNLVPNPSFEQYDTCPNNASQLRYAIPWFQPTEGTPDYYNACAPPPPITYFSVPLNYNGYRTAHSGLAYAGLFLYYYTDNQSTYREYMEVQLTDSLIRGQKYYIRLYVSLSDSSNTATDDLGVYFSSDSITSNNWDTLPVVPQIENLQGNFLTDKVNWMLISGEFIANGGESFMVIGNFKSFFDTDSLHVTGGGSPSPSTDYRNGYYYIDDVCVSSDSTFCLTTSSVKESEDFSYIQIFPNPSNGNIYFESDSFNNDKLTVDIYNFEGMLIRHFE